jgi:hypothetical protein
MSIRPYWAMIACIVDRIESGSARSSRITSAINPRFAISSAAPIALPVSLAAIMTPAPAYNSASLIGRPNIPYPPVTNATLPRRSNNSVDLTYRSPLSGLSVLHFVFPFLPDYIRFLFPASACYYDNSIMLCLCYNEHDEESKG